ncbi:hypothetical protein BEH_07640 [Priestia filamentosa]|uniref:SpoVT-AbrB domain-containing protein n=1 Tax=Priestia filamentosa TaxID=1402861 RepID=A0A0H4KCY6_9BACI|nr:hypothetical protein [Priestia filamentosa]AKO91982.1 hypothetical protein BEH_07640 [Priestia filamentosa]
MTVAVTTDQRDMLINKIKLYIKWPISIFNSFDTDELHNLYTYINEGYTVHKAKVRGNTRSITLRLPKAVTEELGLTYGDRFNLKGNTSRMVILEPYISGKLKLGTSNTINFPALLAAKQLLKPADDTLIVVKDGRIFLKSFTYMQRY